MAVQLKIWNGGEVKQAGCCYSTVVVTQWPTDVKNCLQAEMDIQRMQHRCSHQGFYWCVMYG
ncbi:hypothetical protein NR671_004754, partial [Escherichia coli]|nr:hypothetical protein AC42_0285 [Escherichia coli 2-052-05_S3_C3]SRB29069.1 Uncharacterised protein [Escherichia coli]BBG79233.1 hypothetical protein MYEC217_34350 [Escherichia coli]BBG79254.1 hypothetical protein MYEC217_34560 [Escherichia coli]BDY61100.1 hypothetical protein MUTS6_42390 [Escherichia coli]